MLNIKKLRLAKNMTQVQLAKAVGVSVRQVCNWEDNGLPKVYTRLKVLEKILK